MPVYARAKGTLMPHSFLTRVRLLVVVLFAVLALPGASFAAPPLVHNNFEDQEEDVDICGAIVDIHVTGVETIFVSDTTFKVTGRIQVVYTAEDGRTAVLRAAGPFINTVTENDDGTVTVVDSYRGLPESISGGQGGPVLRDAGLISFITTFDPETGEVVTDIVIRGPHPEAEADFEIFCDAFLEALG